MVAGRPAAGSCNFSHSCCRQLQPAAATATGRQLQQPPALAAATATPRVRSMFFCSAFEFALPFVRARWRKLRSRVCASVIALTFALKNQQKQARRRPPAMFPHRPGAAAAATRQIFNWQERQEPAARANGTSQRREPMTRANYKSQLREPTSRRQEPATTYQSRQLQQPPRSCPFFWKRTCCGLIVI